jgi:malonyl-CoA O-methyltransferase
MLRRFRSLLPARRLAVLPSRAAYALWASSYPPQAHNPFMELEQRAMLELMPPLTGLAVLDLASGSGRYGLLARQSGAARVVAVDDSEAMLAANPLARAQASMVALPFAEAAFDVVLCALAIGHVATLDAAMREIGRVLRSGGTALVSDLHPFLALSGAQRTFHAGDAVYAIEHHVYLYTDMLRAAEAAQLRIDAVREPALDGQTMPTVIVYRLRR